MIGENDTMPPPGVVEAEHLDHLHYLMSQNVLLMRDTLIHARRAGAAVSAMTALGPVIMVVAGILGNGALAALAGGLTAFCAGMAALLWREMARMQQTLNWLEEGLTAWGAAEVQRRLG